MMVGLAVVVIAAAGITWHLTALSAYRASEAPGPTASRLASARFAATLEPWSAPFEWRVDALRGLQLFESGDVDAAYWLLVPNDAAKRDDLLFRSIYQRVVAVKTPRDSSKAHLAHGADPFLAGPLKETTVTPRPPDGSSDE
jgi:hypothetical protein